MSAPLCEGCKRAYANMGFRLGAWLCWGCYVKRSTLTKGERT